jgi:hypothetical protein
MIVSLRTKYITYDGLIVPDPVIQSTEGVFHGAVLVLLQFDVCEAIRLNQLQELIRARTIEPPEPGILSGARGRHYYGDRAGLSVPR